MYDGGDCFDRGVGSPDINLNRKPACAIWHMRVSYSNLFVEQIGIEVCVIGTGCVAEVDRCGRMLV